MNQSENTTALAKLVVTGLLGLGAAGMFFVAGKAATSDDGTFVDYAAKAMLGAYCAKKAYQAATLPTSQPS